MLYLAVAAVLLCVAIHLFAWARVQATLPGLDRAESQRRALAAIAQAAAMVFLAGTFVWRVRSSTALSDAPVDAAAIYRIAADGTALALVLFGLAAEAGRFKSQPLPRRMVAILYASYIGVVLMGVTTAVDPPLVFFRAIDLTVAFTVALALVRWLTAAELLRFVRGALLFLAATVVASVVFFADQALTTGGIGVLPYRVQGIFPVISFNGVGTIGMLLFAVGLGRRPSVDRLATVAGVLLVLASQYRTGYVALPAIAAVWLLTRGGIGRRLLLVLVLPAGFVLARTAYVQSLWDRGDASASTQDLSGRTAYWTDALQVADRSPWIGTGLTSGTRFEVLISQREAFTSTIHNTWVEAYLGTGVVGTAFLAVALLVAIRWSYIARRRSMIPLLFMVGITVRSITGSTIELASPQALFFLVLALAAARLGALPEERDEGEPPAADAATPPRTAQSTLTRT